MVHINKSCNSSLEIRCPPPTDLKQCPHVFLHNCLDLFLPSTNSVSFRFGYLFWSQSQSHLLFFSVSISYPQPFRSTISERDGFDILNLTKRKMTVVDTRCGLNDRTQVKRREPKKTQKDVILMSDWGSLALASMPPSEFKMLADRETTTTTKNMAAGR